MSKSKNKEKKIKIDSFKDRISNVGRKHIVSTQSKVKKNELLINRVLYSWQAPDRIAFDKDTLKVMGIGSMLALVALYLIWVGQPLIAVAVVAMFFLYYVIYTVPPQKVKHSIEKAGIRSIGKLYPWENLIQFWFAEREGRLVMYVESTLAFPKRLFFIINDKNEAEKILIALAQFIPYKTLVNRQTAMDKSFNGRYIPPEEIVDVQALTQAGYEVAKKFMQKRARKSKTVGG